jgi:hypothetical protein
MGDEWSAKFVPEGEPSDIKMVIAEFATAKQATEVGEKQVRIQRVAARC